ncbi:VPA1269 family protein [Vibrio neptunius]|uniref:gamma-mobile-trio integrase GmtZ n=1 Tax=Vibrio neptunius TaxID=170651 RepID=UPI0033162086
MKLNRYKTLSEASLAAKKLGFSSPTQYKYSYKQDPLLPATPDKLYVNEWISWSHFLGIPERKKHYASMHEAMKAVAKLNLQKRGEYYLRYKEDERLPSNPNKTYSSEWKNWSHFLGKEQKALYSSLQEAQNSARKLRILFVSEYQHRYKEDPKLPANPDKVYASDWISWPNFLRGEDGEIYAQLRYASSAVQRLGIKNKSDYRLRHIQDSKLPPNPDEYYSTEWISWEQFLSKCKKEYYDTIEKASMAAIKLGIKSMVEYKARYREDQSLPPKPYTFYSESWINWLTFLGQPVKKNYSTLKQARRSTLRLGIKSSNEYRFRYTEDRLLPAKPERIYAHEWRGWPWFLGKQVKDLYPTLSEAIKAVKVLGINSFNEYQERYREDEKLPTNPHRFYKDEWINWPTFFSRNERTFYSNIEAARASVQALGITSITEYRVRYKEDPCLPALPERTYAADWRSWWDYLQPKNILDLKSFKAWCSALKIKNSVEYKKARKVHSNLPSKPEKTIHDWTDWFDALNIPRPYSYRELEALVRKNSITTLSEYREFRASSQDPRMPVKPEEQYKGKGWTNAYDLWGTPRPYRVKYFTEDWRLWAEKIKEFLKTARAGDTKTKDLCEFVREYIEPNLLEKCPLEFLTRESTNIQPMLALLDQVPVTRKKKWIFSINEFLDWIISNYLILEDTETGEVTHIKGAKNPFSHISFNDEAAPNVVNETPKMSLPYQYVKAGRDWIFPLDSIENKLSYRDLSHLHRFPSDWVEINDNTILDHNDPDCVFKVENGKTYLWFPAYWTYTYSLMQLPARGMQIVYSDSGEADKELADFKNGKVVWKKNRTKLAGLTNRQSMVSKSGQGEFGVHYTSNKTKFDGSGYTIPFMPIDLAYWLVKMRKWQHKYNPIIEPTKWLDCTRTNLNEVQRKHKGINCFLFREFKQIEPGYFSGRLTDRLAAALFFSGKKDVTTATYRGLKYAKAIKDLESSEMIPLSHFKSPYTPHSMRVSLINAYAYEFGIPLEVIMKLVGHSSIIMTIYYTKSGKTGANLREKMELGEKEAMSKATQTLKSFVEQQRIEEVKSQLVGASVDLLNSLDNARPASSYLWKDFGICPVGGAFCSEGGCPVATKANIYHPVPGGYLGEQNCVQCRFFITGPAFLVGLAAMFNEISLAVRTQSIRYTSLGQKLDDIAEKIDVIDHQLYQIKVDSSEKSTLESDRRELVGERMHLNSEIETRAKKLDLYLSDMNAIHRHIHNCQTLMRNPKEKTENHYQLIVPHEFTLGVELDEVSSFHQLSEVCSNAELYHSCSDDLAVTRRSQMIDKMMVENGIQPQFFLLSEEEQLAVGNQLTELMLTRLKGWENVDRLMDGRLMLKDLSIDNQFGEKTIRELFDKSKPLQRIG